MICGPNHGEDGRLFGGKSFELFMGEAFCRGKQFDLHHQLYVHLTEQKQRNTQFEELF